MRLFRKARFFWVYPLAVWLFITAQISESSLRLGIIFVVLGEALRLWANGFVGHMKVNLTQKWRNDPKIGRLITAGPYAFVRHPLYLGTFLIGIGFCIAVRNVLAGVGALGFFYFMYTKKVQREEAIILGEWGSEFEAYQRVVPRWWPFHRPYASGVGRWSWQGISASKEIKTVLWVAAAFLMLYFREEIWQEREWFVAKKWAKHLILLACFMILIASDGVLELSKRLRQRAPHAGTTQ